MSYTPNINLMLTPEDDTSTTFKQWRTGMNGEDSDSNMMKIDEAVGALDEHCDRLQAKVDTVSSKVFGESPQTWADVQTIVRSGAASQYFDVGDQFIVERLTGVTASVGESEGISAVTVDSNTFVDGMGEVHAGDYLFTYDGVSWRNEVGEIVNIETLGITYTGTPTAGDNITVTEASTQLAFDVIGIDHDTPADANHTHSMTLQLHNLWSSTMTYDAAEAMFAVDAETYPDGLPAGTYNFTWNYATGSMVNGTYQFTIEQPIPIGGQIVIETNSSSTAITSCKIKTYATAGATKTIETNIAIITGTEGTSLGTILSTTSSATNLNCAQRIMWGSNNWSESSLRQWLNTDAAANSWWEPKTVFDRPANTDSVGFLKDLDPAFLDVIGDVTKTTQLSVSDDYGLETSTERFFLLSRPEVYAGTERSADGTDGTVYVYYGAGYSDLTAPGTGADSNRIKYRNGSATYWWLRTPHSTVGGHVRNVHPTGSLNIYNANNSTGVAPACVIV
ncbi:MAG: DUF6273 domain-containing protein [Clostridia bacterium]|nr:DUF6273 domain-containing protein [Clostridia bacterium]